MGEIIFSILIGGILALSGVAMNAVLKREEKKVLSGREKTPPKAR